MISKVFTAGVAAAMMMCGTAFAQTSTPAAPAPTAAPAAAPAMTSKQAKSKECSMEADKQGLHGKARKTFRSKCKSGHA